MPLFIFWITTLLDLFFSRGKKKVGGVEDVIPLLSSQPAKSKSNFTSQKLKIEHQLKKWKDHLIGLSTFVFYLPVSLHVKNQSSLFRISLNGGIDTTWTSISFIVTFWVFKWGKVRILIYYSLFFFFDFVFRMYGLVLLLRIILQDYLFSCFNFSLMRE